MWVLGWMHDVNGWIRVLRCGAGSGVPACCELGRVDFGFDGSHSGRPSFED